MIQQYTHTSVHSVSFIPWVVVLMMDQVWTLTSGLWYS